MILDSNIIIYASQPDNGFLLDFIAENSPVVSAVSYIEVLGYMNLSPEERNFLTTFFNNTAILPINQPIVLRATTLRQQRRMSLGDAIIAATALEHDLTLVTRNTNDFHHLVDLRLHNPF